MAKICTLNDMSNETVYPRTLTDAVFTKDGAAITEKVDNMAILGSPIQNTAEINLIDAEYLGGHTKDYFITKDNIDTYIGAYLSDYTFRRFSGNSNSSYASGGGFMQQFRNGVNIGFHYASDTNVDVGITTVYEYFNITTNKTQFVNLANIPGNIFNLKSFDYTISTIYRLGDITLPYYLRTDANKQLTVQTTFCVIYKDGLTCVGINVFFDQIDSIVFKSVDFHEYVQFPFITRDM